MKPLKALISKNTLHRAHTNTLVEIDNFTYNDAITPGNILLIEGGRYDIHHAIVVNLECAHRLNLPINCKHMAATLNVVDDLVGFWDLDDNIDGNFPNFRYGAKIIKMYSTNIDVSKITTQADVKKLFDNYKLKRIKVK